jgi:phosphomannomutase
MKAAKADIKFGTDGWRAIIADDYTVENVIRVAEATALWMKNKAMASAVVGYDCRFGGPLFAEVTARTLAAHGIVVWLSDGFVSTPMVSLAVVQKKAGMGIVITASHNPPSYNGFKLKSSYGGPTIPADIAQVESLIPEKAATKPAPFDYYLEKRLIMMIDMDDLYEQHIRANFDFDKIEASKIRFAYDSMYGAGQKIMHRLFPNMVHLHMEHNPNFDGQAPEPIDRNLELLRTTVANDPDLHLGIANDGDADRIGMYDENGEFVDSHRILLLLLRYLREYKKLDGKVIITFSVTDKMERLARHYGLDVEVTKIGFKYIAEIMTHEKVLVGGEESGGLAVAGHIPERDGIWVALVILEYMAKTGKKLTELVDEVYDIVGPFSYDRDDLHLTEAQKQGVIKRCETEEITQIGDYKVVRREDLDGFKFFFEAPDGWLMIRPSGTEPVLRVYAQAPDAGSVRRILDAARDHFIG